MHRGKRVKTQSHITPYTSMNDFEKKYCAKLSHIDNRQPLDNNHAIDELNAVV